MIHVGIDLHTRNMVNVALNDNGQVVREAKLPTSPKALEGFFAPFDEPVQAVVECTSSWYWLSDWCQANDVPLKLAHAKMVKAISYAKVKTDTVDAKTLAELFRAGLIPEAYQIKPERRALRELTRGRLRMIQRRGKLQSRLEPRGQVQRAYRSGPVAVSGETGRMAAASDAGSCSLRDAADT